MPQKIVVTFVTILLLQGVVGCTTTQSSPEREECLQFETLEWYSQCRKLFEDHGVVWIQDVTGYTPRDRHTGVPRYHQDQRWEILRNSCPIKWDSTC